MCSNEDPTQPKIKTERKENQSLHTHGFNSRTLSNSEATSGRMLKAKLESSAKWCNVFCSFFLLRDENESSGPARERDSSYHTLASVLNQKSTKPYQKLNEAPTQSSPYTD